MITKIALPAMLMATALAGVPMSYAATAAPAAMTPSGAPQSTTKPAEPAVAKTMPPTGHAMRYLAYSDRVNAKDIAAFGASKIALDKAIAAAESKTGEKAVEAAFKASPKQPHYVVWTLGQGRVLTNWVDPNSGAVTEIGAATAMSRLHPAERAELMAAGKARLSLADAVTMASANGGDQPIAASLEGPGHMRHYEVIVVHQGATQSVWVPSDNPPLVAAK